jgi:hypothetical protein
MQTLVNTVRTIGTWRRGGAGLCLLVVLTAGAGPLAVPSRTLAQKAVSSAPVRDEVPRLTIRAKIVYQEKTASYVVVGVDPPQAHYFVLNENPTVLDKLVAKNQAVTIEGTLPQGAEFIEIHKIDGQPYSAPQERRN